MSKPRSKKYIKEEKEHMYTINFSPDPSMGVLDQSAFNTLNPTQTQSDLDELRKETSDRLDALEDQVLLVRRDAILEEDYKELKAAWTAYNDLLEKLRTFKRLKDSV